MVKEATGSLDQASQILCGSNLTILSGDDSLTLPLMAIGGEGVVSVVGNIVPQEMLRLVAAAAVAGLVAMLCKEIAVIFPVAKAAQGEAFLKFVEQKRRFYFDNYFKRVLHRPTGDRLRPGAEDQRRGYVMFRRDYMQDVYYNDTPNAGQIGGPLRGDAGDQAGFRMRQHIGSRLAVHHQRLSNDV